MSQLMLIPFVLIFEGCTTEKFPYENIPIPLAVDQTTRLDFSSAPGTSGGVGQLEALGNMAMRWDDNGTITWNVEVLNTAVYRASISYASMDTQADIILESSGESLQNDLPKSQSIFDDNLDIDNLDGLDMSEEFLINYDRFLFSEELSLEAGIHEISLNITELEREEVIDFRALELTPTDVPSMAENEEEIRPQRAKTDWMVDAKYGVMIHWTDMSVNPDGSQKEYKDAVADFDVEAFADLSEEIGAGFILFTLNHQYPHCPAPLVEWENIHPGWTTERDLIAELSEELDSRGIPLMLYVASHLIGNPDGVEEVDWLKAHQFGQESDLQEDTNFDIFENNKTILTALGARYEERVVGFWLDGWDLIPEKYPHIEYKELFDASKVGNPDRVVTFNRWIFPTVNPWQDYWAGEVDSPDRAPTSRYMETEVGFGLQFQSLIAMEDDWVYTAENLEEDYFYIPRYSAEELIEYIQVVNSVEGMVTINLAIHQDGTLDTSTLNIMKEVKEAIR
jgi:hypothetical protein